MRRRGEERRGGEKREKSSSDGQTGHDRTGQTGKTGGFTSTFLSGQNKTMNQNEERGRYRVV
ncbi:hypothetical protein BTUL_0129g00290 [Botrytis tulipae]|uniref:Uncharacterized protein n=1 Tax=Botrytis tulipae TaxID=87230 RepID=A0A4Z1ENP0_9HELO|nr:hypothetical protein BTUL_0129g00290 [Botrytis tulipae]